MKLLEGLVIAFVFVFALSGVIANVSAANENGPTLTIYPGSDGYKVSNGLSFISISDERAEGIPGNYSIAREFLIAGKNSQTYRVLLGDTILSDNNTVVLPFANEIIIHLREGLTHVKFSE